MHLPLIWFGLQLLLLYSPLLGEGVRRNDAPSWSDMVGEGIWSPFLLLVNHVFTRCSVMPSVSPSGPRIGEPLFIAISASLHTRANSSRCSRVGKWFCRGEGVCGMTMCVWEGARRYKREHHSLYNKQHLHWTMGPQESWSTSYLPQDHSTTICTHVKY